jgi:hypothetical protein
MQINIVFEKMRCLLLFRLVDGAAQCESPSARNLEHEKTIASALGDANIGSRKKELSFPLLYQVSVASP